MLQQELARPEQKGNGRAQEKAVAGAVVTVYLAHNHKVRYGQHVNAWGFWLRDGRKVKAESGREHEYREAEFVELRAAIEALLYFRTEGSRPNTVELTTSSAELAEHANRYMQLHASGELPLPPLAPIWGELTTAVRQSGSRVVFRYTRADSGHYGQANAKAKADEALRVHTH